MGGRCGNLYENKGPAFRSLGKSGNVLENKRSYALKAGMFLKTKRIQESGVRSQDEEHLLIAHRLLLSVIRRPSTASRGSGMEKDPCRCGRPGQDVIADREERGSDFKN